MFLTVHSAAGLALAQYIKNPLLAFITGFISHYIFDIIPHGDTNAPKKYYNIIYLTTIGIFDLAVTSSFFLLLMLFRNKLLTLAEICAIVGSLMPDGLQVLYFIFPRQKHLLKIQKIHKFFHDLISKKLEFSLPVGIIFQLIIFSILIIISL